MKTTVIYHSADFDGIFSREIAKKFLGDTDVVYIGWDHGDPEIPFPTEGEVYVIDLPADRVFGFDFKSMGALDSLDDTTSISQPSSGIRAFLVACKRVIWIDHHASSIASHPKNITGYRIDGVAACRLAWQWFALMAVTPNPEQFSLPDKHHFFDRQVQEPLAVRLAGEYDIWDKRDPRTDILQLGLRSKELTAEDWKWLLTSHDEARGEYELGMVNVTLAKLLQDGRLLQTYVNQRDAAIVEAVGFVVEFEGVNFLALNSATKGSLQFASKDVPETGHDALLKFNFTGKQWDVSLYHAKHRKDLDLSQIAVKHGGGGHRGACGFRAATLPFLK